MIVVVIIGILAAVAIPSYQGFQDRAKATEAKVQLSGIYTAEKAYFAENNKYSIVLADIGADLGSTKYYTVGFKGTTVTNRIIQTPAPSTAFNLDAKCLATAVAGGTGSAGTLGFKACAQKTGTYAVGTDWNINDARNLNSGAP